MTPFPFDSWPTLQELLQLPFVRKHLQLLLGRGGAAGPHGSGRINTSQQHARCGEQRHGQR
jgi:hypothetical protein